MTEFLDRLRSKEVGKHLGELVAKAPKGLETKPDLFGGKVGIREFVHAMTQTTTSVIIHRTELLQPQLVGREIVQSLVQTSPVVTVPNRSWCRLLCIIDGSKNKNLGLQSTFLL